MRTVSPELQADIEDDCTSLARLWTITRTDNTALYITDSDAPITFGGHLYRADLGFTASSIVISGDYVNAQSVTIVVAMTSDGLNEDDLRMKRYDGAKGELTIINYLAPDHGIMKVFTGKFGRVEIGDKGAANIELIPFGSSLSNHTIGTEVYSATCRNSFGDTHCSGPDNTVDLTVLTKDFTVDAVSLNVIVASELTDVDNQYAGGFIIWVTGDNAGLRSPVARSASGATSITLTQVPPKPIVIGDTGQAVPGCDKTLDMCITKWLNILNFRGEPNVPDTSFLPMVTMGSAPEGN